MKNVAIISGASSGLGSEFVVAVLEKYAIFGSGNLEYSKGKIIEPTFENLQDSIKINEIWLIARREKSKYHLDLNALESKYSGVKFVYFSLDLGQDSSFITLQNALNNGKPNVRILINNAGFERDGAFINMQNSDIITLLDLNIKGATLLSKIVLPFMLENLEVFKEKVIESNLQNPQDSIESKLQNSQVLDKKITESTSQDSIKNSKNPNILDKEITAFIVMVGSVSGFAPIPNQAVYAASKGYIEYFSKALAFELKDSNVNVLLFCPGNMDTEMNSRADTISRGGKFSKLPFLNIKKETRIILQKAERGEKIYTALPFYKFYRFLSKIIPNNIIMKFNKY
ncbi:SDR family NAD(P)-dependent oxidoreductase [Helicobacter saguini]|uniref:SDR family NAD(P)-dependent oxidoreductase n=1 Tax=Helicobacter saguini TaxID=1548018 RepID=A0A347VV35_9HELI|nr:SDR family NAD(P)-dependent oxidoreductase [Helicobacter saguini]MWV62590.1 SDR family NAD(P)-dependent oxidoreductase [Helicobacter saguini]MWV66736.1 SDR family NAD(P)-dependent oxidoreductase [Helicobacter saguini]MWV69087.1 SDR family NAD(P)-dependent oxidoreductase [Helicobacter saguini]MWV71359.1 SDR family NAD(P)-dependent oxidoreductase [Helicobacter saguini]TLD93995.1 SDR family NAD(P)-dependent oxidoreductase [Helicobacter saguini]